MTGATREQIKMDADQYATVQYGDRDKLGLPEAITIWDAGQEDFEAGAISQHAISFEAGRSAAIDEAIEIARSVDPAFMVQELEALKR